MSTNSVPKQIIAMGGGGFSMEPENPLLDRYILGLSKKKRPKICFIPTASGDSDKYIVRFYSAFVQLLCQPSHLSLFNPPTSDFRSFVLEQDIIYLGGGNTKNLILAVLGDYLNHSSESARTFFCIPIKKRLGVLPCFHPKRFLFLTCSSHK